MNTPIVTVFSKPNCAQCDQTKRHLKKIKVDFTEVDITTSPTDYEYVKSLGYLAAPVVVVSYPLGGDDHWSGYRFDNLNALEWLFGDATEKDDQ